MFQNVIFDRNPAARWIQGKTRPTDFFFFSLFDHCIHLKHGKHAVHKAQAQSVYVEINIELKHSPLMNKKKNKKKTKNKNEKWWGGYWSCRTLQSANEGYVAWQNSVIATHKWGIRQDVANGKQSHLTWLLGSCLFNKWAAGWLTANRRWWW